MSLAEAFCLAKGSARDVDQDPSAARRASGAYRACGVCGFRGSLHLTASQHGIIPLDGSCDAFGTLNPEP